jgi:NADPH:quinone reductase-like Zn-dependent oxidoreductase
MPQTVAVMKAVQLMGYGDIDQLKYQDVAMPEPGPGEVLIKVAATSVNPVDWKIRSGAVKEIMPVSFPVIPGRDVAGTVVETGANVRNLKTDQKVIGMAYRTYAQYVTAPADTLTVIPDGLDMEEAAALPVVTTTGAELNITSQVSAHRRRRSSLGLVQ